MSRKHRDPPPPVDATPTMPPPRPPMGDGRNCEACSAETEIAWHESHKRYECAAGCAVKLPDGVVARPDDDRPARVCGTCHRSVAVRAVGCPHCTPRVIVPNVQNIATPSRIRTGDAPSVPWIRR